MSSPQLDKDASLSHYLPEYLPEEYIKLPWQPIYKETKISPKDLIVKDQWNNVIPAQVFQIDPVDPSHDFLIISLRDIVLQPQEIAKFVQSLKMEKGERQRIENRGFPRLESVLGPNGEPRGCGLDSGKLRVWFNLIPSPEDYDDDWNWYAGSATSVLVDGKEMLEYFINDEVPLNFPPSWMRHDPQKRCMQIDKIQVWDKINKVWSAPYNLFDQSYEFISSTIGAVGVSITVASTPLRYNEAKDNNQCRLYRVISLFKDADYILEDLYLHKVEGNSKDDQLEFKVHYFTFMDLYFRPQLIVHPSGRKFVMMSCLVPYPAYGFMSNITIESGIDCPTRDFPEWPNKYKTFSWGLSPCKSAQCYHTFTLTFDNLNPDFSSPAMFQISEIIVRDYLKIDQENSFIKGYRDEVLGQLKRFYVEEVEDVDSTKNGNNSDNNFLVRSLPLISSFIQLSSTIQHFNEAMEQIQNLYELDKDKYFEQATKLSYLVFAYAIDKGYQRFYPDETWKKMRNQIKSRLRDKLKEPNVQYWYDLAHDYAKQIQSNQEIIEEIRGENQPENQKTKDIERIEDKIQSLTEKAVQKLQQAIYLDPKYEEDAKSDTLFDSIWYSLAQDYGQQVNHQKAELAKMKVEYPPKEMERTRQIIEQEIKTTTQQAIKYLQTAIETDSKNKERAIADESFKFIKDDEDFVALTKR